MCTFQPGDFTGCGSSEGVKLFLCCSKKKTKLEKEEDEEVSV